MSTTIINTLEDEQEPFKSKLDLFLDSIDLSAKLLGLTVQCWAYRFDYGDRIVLNIPNSLQNEVLDTYSDEESIECNQD